MEILEIQLKFLGKGLCVLPPSSIQFFFPGEAFQSIFRMPCGVGLFSLVVGSDPLAFFKGETNLILGLCLLGERANVGLRVFCSLGESCAEGRLVQRVMKCGLGGEGQAVRCARGCGEGERRESMGIIEYIANMFVFYCCRIIKTEEKQANQERRPYFNRIVMVVQIKLPQTAYLFIIISIQQRILQNNNRDQDDMSFLQTYFLFIFSTIFPFINSMNQRIWLLFLLTAILCDDCSPLYTRIFYDPIPAPELKVDMIVMFNTLSICTDSYVHVKYLNSQDEFPCTIEKVTIPSNIPEVPYLQHYVHSCSLEIDSASQVDQFTYSILPADTPVTYAVELASDALPFRMVVMANVDMLNDAGYRPFAEAFQTLMNKREEELARKQGQNHYRINAMVLNGGFAKDFSGNKGQNFNKIMRMISQFSAVWPLMLNMGPSEYTLEAEMKLITQCFLFGGVAPGGDNRIAMQGYSLARKVNVIFLETSTQYYAGDNQLTAEFNRTLDSLKSYLSSREKNGNEFNIVLNHFPLFCSDKDDGSPFSCQQALDNLAPLKEQLSSGVDYPPVDLYIAGFLDDYQRNYPYRQGNFMTLEQSRYGRGDFININEGVAGLDSPAILPKTENVFTAVRDQRPGFGLLTIKGYGELRQKAPGAVIEKQTVARRIYDQQHARGSGSDLLDENYLKKEDLSELDLFLLNYKHVVVDSENGLVIADVFRIVTDPEGKTMRHQLRAQ